MKTLCARSKVLLFSFCVFIFLCTLSCAFTNAASAEEYFAIGMAYFDLGKYSEAETWLNRAMQAGSTKTASEYNLGRIAFESGRYSEAALYFESILKQDEDNIMALKAYAYTKIKMGDIEGALKVYDRILHLVPQDADDGYNYALVLFAVERYKEAEEVLERYRSLSTENFELLLLLARIQDALGNVQAVDSYALAVDINKSNNVRFEYAEVLEKHTFYARSLEQYREILKSIADSSVNPSRNQVNFAIVRVLLIADSESDEGINELKSVLSDGGDLEGARALLQESKISDSQKHEILKIIEEYEKPVEAPPLDTEEAEDT